MSGQASVLECSPGVYPNPIIRDISMEEQLRGGTSKLIKSKRFETRERQAGLRTRDEPGVERHDVNLFREGRLSTY